MVIRNIKIFGEVTRDGAHVRYSDKSFYIRIDKAEVVILDFTNSTFPFFNESLRLPFFYLVDENILSRGEILRPVIN